MQSNDLISRAAVLDAIDHERNLLIEQKRFGAEHVVVHHARRLIEEFPTVDAAPVVHGRWVEKEVNTESNVIESWQSAKCIRCNRFHTTPYSYYYTNYDYCPRCGAKMDGDGE